MGLRQALIATLGTFVALIEEAIGMDQWWHACWKPSNSCVIAVFTRTN